MFEIIEMKHGHTLPSPKQFWFGPIPTNSDVMSFSNFYLRCEFCVSNVDPLTILMFTRALSSTQHTARPAHGPPHANAERRTQRGAYSSS